MSDAIRFTGLDAFFLKAALNPQNTSIDRSFERSQQTTRHGDICKESDTRKADQINVRTEYTYCGTNLKTEAAVSAFLATCKPVPGFIGSAEADGGEDAGATSIGIDAGMPGANEVIKEGTFIVIGDAVYAVADDVTLDATGLGEVEIVPPLASALAALAAIRLTSAAVTEINITADTDSGTRVSISGHFHGISAPNAATIEGGHKTLAAFDVAALIASNIQAVDVPAYTDIPGVSNEGDGIKSIEYAIAIQHTDITGKGGMHLSGTNRACSVALSMTGSGAPPVLNGTTWIDDPESGESGMEGTTWTRAAHQNIVRT